MNAKTYSLHNAYGPDSTVSFDAAQGLRRREEALSGLRQRVYRFPNFEKPVLRLTPPLNVLWLEGAAFEVLPLRRLGAPVSRHAREGNGRDVLHVRSRAGQQPALYRDRHARTVP
jgi:hypothetical protein